jgi:hypothetical protein
VFFSPAGCQLGDWQEAISYSVSTRKEQTRHEDVFLSFSLVDAHVNHQSADEASYQETGADEQGRGGLGGILGESATPLAF